MPTYQYRCQTCDHDLEVVQKFTDAPLTRCPRCHGALRKVFSPVGIVFKGSGFYSTDSHRHPTASPKEAPGAVPQAAVPAASPSAPAEPASAAAAAPAPTPATAPA